MSDKQLFPIEAADLGTLLYQRPDDIPQRVQIWIDDVLYERPIHSLVMRLVVPGRANVQISYGFNPTIGATGNDDITRRELGGVISAYFTMMDGQLWVGMLNQKRPCQDLVDSVLNVIRAYYSPEKSRLSVATERAQERAGAPVSLLAVELPCDQGNNNNANVETHGGNGNTQFAFYVPPEMLILAPNGAYMFDDTVVTAFDPDAGKILGLEFHPWKVAAKVGDDFTRAIVAPLMAWLDDMDQISVFVTDQFDPSVMTK